MMIVAPRRSGKSHFIQKMLREGLTERFDHIFIFCPTINTGFDSDVYIEFRPTLTDHAQKVIQARPIVNCDGFELAPTTTILPLSERRKIHQFADVDQDHVKALMGEQMEVLNGVNDRELRGNYELRAPRGLFVFDDCVGENILGYTGVVSDIASRGRHYATSVILVTQHLNRVPRTARWNADYIVLFKPGAVQEFQSFLEQFFLREDRKQALQYLLKEVLYQQPYRFLVLSPTAVAQFPRLGISDADQFVHVVPEPINL